MSLNCRTLIPSQCLIFRNICHSSYSCLPVLYTCILYQYFISLEPIESWERIFNPKQISLPLLMEGNAILRKVNRQAAQLRQMLCSNLDSNALSIFSIGEVFAERTVDMLKDRQLTGYSSVQNLPPGLLLTF